MKTYGLLIVAIALLVVASPMLVVGKENPKEQPDSKAAAKVESKTDLPEGWKLDEIASAAKSVADLTYVLAWKIEEDDRPLRVENCLVLCQLEKGRWSLMALFRHPKDEKPEWEQSRVHVTPEDPRRRGGYVWLSRTFDKRPSNKEVYDFMDEFRWRLGADEGFKLLGGKVCADTWEAVIKEKPTRLFPKEK